MNAYGTADYNWPLKHPKKEDSQIYICKIK